MTRGRVTALAAVLVLLGVALVLGTRSGGPPRSTVSAAVLEARATTALPPCPPGLGVDLPGLRLPCLAPGPDVPVAAPPGRPTLVNVWGTWCGPCVGEVPELVQLAAKAGDRLGVVGVATEDSQDSVYAFARTYGVNYPQVRDDLGVVLRRFASSGAGVPKTVFVTAAGQVAFVQVGAFTTQAQLEDAVAEHLGVRL